MHEELLDPLDRFIDQENDQPSRPEAIRRILKQWLAEHGFLPQK